MQGRINLFQRVVLGGLTAVIALGVASQAMAQSTLEKVREQDYIRVGFANEAPYSYATTSGVLTGESPTVFKHVMEQIGVDEVDGVLTEWGALIPGLKAGRFDAIVASMYITPQRCEQVIFSNPTYGIGEAFIVQAGNPDGVNTYQDAIDKDKKIAFIAGTAEVAHAEMAGLDDDNMLMVPDFSSGIAAVKAGRAAAVALTSLTAKEFAEGDDAIDRAEPFIFEHEGKQYLGQGAFAFRPEDTALRNAVNDVLDDFIGSQEHLEMIAEFGFDESNLPVNTAAELCAGE